MRGVSFAPGGRRACAAAGEVAVLPFHLMERAWSSTPRMSQCLRLRLSDGSAGKLAGEPEDLRFMRDVSWYD